MISLPFDIQVLILPFLTSTSLISLSQTSRHFRQLIDPQRKHFLNRLLELECLPEYGGEVTINEQAKIIVPPGNVSYTCSHCLKILCHTHFDNHSLLRLRFRKPPPESRAGQQLCGWMGGDAKAQGIQRQAKLWNDTMYNWTWQSASPSIPTPRLREFYNIGTARHRRICNECKFKIGYWARVPNCRRDENWGRKHRNSNVGISTVPAVKGRQRRVHDSTERYFPGLFPVADDNQYPWRYKISRAGNHDWWTLWSIRCPGCAKWQERAAFRKGCGYGVNATPADPDEWREEGWDGPKWENWRCNRCFAASHGEEELAKQLLAFWKRLAKFEIQMYSWNLPSGWWAIQEMEKATNNKYSWDNIVRRDSVRSQLLRRIPKPEDIREMEPKQRLHYYQIFKRWYDALENPEEQLGSLLDRNFFRNWIHEYEILNKRLEDMAACMKILEVDPGRLVRFALDGNDDMLSP